jgi:hypothetical protein
MGLFLQQHKVKCSVCGRELGEKGYLTSCPFCGGIPVIEYEAPVFKVDESKPGILRYGSLLPQMRVAYTRGEGLTPIMELDGVLVKNERFNPTGSYADRASALISSHIASSGIRRIKVRYEPGFTRSLSYYLPRGVRAHYCVEKPLEIDVDDLFELASRGELSACGNSVGVPVEYTSALTVEGLKTIVFEIYEKRVSVEYIVVPAMTGVLAFSLAKGLRELERSELAIDLKVIAVFPEGAVIPDFLKNMDRVEIVRASSEDALDSFNYLLRKGIYTVPLSAMGFQVAKIIQGSIAVLTIGYKPRSRRRRSKLAEEVLKTLEKLDRATAYEIWRNNPESSLRGVYKAIKSLMRDGLVCEEPVSRGRRKIILYRLCS